MFVSFIIRLNQAKKQEGQNLQAFSAILKLR